MSNGPTPTQIAQVQTNLKNMQALNDYIYNQGGSSRISNAYLLLSEQDSSDLGLTIVLNIFEGIFWAIGGIFGPIGNFTASFLSGMVSYWATSANTPPSLNSTFASTALRIQQTSLEVDQQLAAYYNDVAGNWNTSFTYNGNAVSLADLATINFPAETDNAFFPLAQAGIFALDQMIWKTVLTASFAIGADDSYSWVETFGNISKGSPGIIPGDSGTYPTQFYESWLAAYPADYAYNQWNWFDSPVFLVKSGWWFFVAYIGNGNSYMSNDACKYLFIDSADGVVINSEGLYTRATVFNSLGIKNNSGFGSQTSPSSVMVDKFVKSLACANLRQTVIAEAKKDPEFARNVVAQPRETLETFFGKTIPENIYQRLLQEAGGNFASLVPQDDQ